MHLLGGGITKLAVSELPTQLTLYLALMLEGEESEFVGDHKGAVEIFKLGDSTRIARATFSWLGGEKSPNWVEGLPFNIGLAIPLHPARIPSAGVYRIEVSAQGETVSEIRLAVSEEPVSGATPMFVPVARQAGSSTTRQARTRRRGTS